MRRRNKGYRADTPRSYADIEQLALRAREFVLPNIKVDEQIDPVRLFEEILPGKFVRANDQILRIDPAVKDLSHGVLGQTTHESGSLVVALSVETYERMEGRDSRAGFTLSHELGHAFLHAPEIIRLSSIPHTQEALMRGRADHPRYLDTEWQANAFAAAFLAPARGMRALEGRIGKLRPEDLQRHFGLSYEAACYRIDNWEGRRNELLR